MGGIFSYSEVERVLEAGLKGLARRHKVLANNIANVDTPNFKRSDIDFQGTLRKIIKSSEGGSLPLKTTNPRHIPNLTSGSSDISFVPVKDFSNTYRKDGNNVDIEKEVAEINKNAVMYNSLLRLLVNELSMQRYAIEEGRR